LSLPFFCSFQYETLKADYLKQLNALNEEIEKLAPHTKALGQFDEIANKESATKADWEEKKKIAKARLFLFVPLSLLSFVPSSEPFFLLLFCLFLK
jgi:hypothetical protein